MSEMAENWRARVAGVLTHIVRACFSQGKGKEEAEAVADDDDYIDEDEVPEMPRHSDGRFMSNQEVKSAAAKSQSGFQKVESLPPPTQLVPDGKEFTIGDFMVLKSDANRDSAPIWR